MAFRQHFKFKNWRIGGLENSIFDVTNRLVFSTYQVQIQIEGGRLSGLTEGVVAQTQAKRQILGRFDGYFGKYLKLHQQVLVSLKYIEFSRAQFCFLTRPCPLFVLSFFSVSAYLWPRQQVDHLDPSVRYFQLKISG